MTLIWSTPGPAHLLPLAIAMLALGACGEDAIPENSATEATDTEPSQATESTGPSDTDGTLSGGDPDVDLDTSTGANADTDTDTDTDADTDTDSGVELPNDCSCYDPFVDADVGFQAACRSAEETLPGCSLEENPCGVVLIDADQSPPAPDQDALRCVTEQLAKGDIRRFSLRHEYFNGRTDQEYVPLTDGSYGRFSCGLLDNPPIQQSVRTVSPATPSYFADCLENNPDAAPLFECVEAGFAEADPAAALAACEG